MTEYCKNCPYLDLNDKELWGDRYYCPKTRKYRELNERACDQFVERPNGGYQRTGCPITVLAIQKLGLDDNCTILKTLRNFRENYLNKNSEGIKILQEYDQIGPVLSKYLEKETIDEAKKIFTNFIIPITQEICKNNSYEAIMIYKNMIIYLKEKYGLLNFEINYSLKTPSELLGKARIRTTN